MKNKIFYSNFKKKCLNYFFDEKKKTRSDNDIKSSLLSSYLSASIVQKWKKK